METIVSALTLILSFFGLTLIQGLTLGYNFVMGYLSIWITNALKVGIAWVVKEIPFLGPLLTEETETKIKGWLTPLISGLVGMLFVWIGTLFGLSFFPDQSTATTLLAGFGLNASVAQIMFEKRKAAAKAAATKAST